jgi:F-type H+-transporting ATPase subunit gamma
LCGGFNLSLVGFANDFARQEEELGHQVKIVALGRYGERFFGRTPREVIYAHRLPLIHAISFTGTREIYERIEDLYQVGEFDRLHLIHNSFVSFGRYHPTEIRLLPPHLTIPQRGEAKKEHIIGSDTAQLQRYLLAEYVAVQIHLGLVDSMLSEQAARLQTMESALTNIQDRIDGLVLEHNIARQEGITQEVLEISAGAQALGLRGSWP